MNFFRTQSVSGGEPPFQTPIEPERGPHPPREPGGYKKAAISILVGAIILTLLLFLAVPSYTRIASAGDAQDAIAEAQAAIDKAAPAAEPGSPEAAELSSANQALSEARSHDEAGSFFNPGEYRSAEEKAQEAKATAETISNRVAGLLAEAKAQMTGAGGAQRLSVTTYSKTFDLAKRYPRTSEAAEVLAIGEDTFVGSMSGTESLKAAADFTALFPRKSDKIVSKARELLTGLADSNYTSLSADLKNNQDFVAALKALAPGATVVRKRLAGNTPQETAALREAQGAATAPTLYQPPEMQRLISLLAEASAMSEEPGGSTTRTWSDSQLDRIAEINTAMASRLNEAQTLLNALKASQR